MNDDWQVGDKAVCVDDRPHPRWGASGLRLGSVYTVIRASFDPGWSALYGREDWGLWLAEIQPSAPRGFTGGRFRKIRPDAHEACETEFVTLLKRSKRKVSA